VTARGQRLNEFAVVVEQARDAVVHDELVAVASADERRHDDTGEGEDDDEDLFGGHGVVLVCGWKICDPRRRPPLGSGQRGVSRLRRAELRLRSRVRTRVSAADRFGWESNPVGFQPIAIRRFVDMQDRVWRCRPAAGWSFRWKMEVNPLGLAPTSAA
jgi:hypothetical protein